jgi:Effector Associated Constant Component 1
VRVRLAVDDRDPEAVRSLRAWLLEEHPVRVHGELGWAQVDRPGQMGILIDVLTLVVGSGLSLSQLALSIARWRTSRHPAPVVTITREVGDGTIIRIETSDPEAVANAVRELEAG